MSKFYEVNRALVCGVQEVEGSCGYPYPGIILTGIWTYRLGIDAFERREDAVRAANEMKQKEILRLKAKLAKLEALEF